MDASPSSVRISSNRRRQFPVTSLVGDTMSLHLRRFYSFHCTHIVLEFCKRQVSDVKSMRLVCMEDSVYRDVEMQIDAR